MHYLIAFRNMLRAAARDPLWALVSVVTSPLRVWPVLVSAIALVLGVGIVLAFSLEAATRAMGLAGKNIIAVSLNLALVVFLCWLAFRILARPLLEHFGEQEGATHGSARFATDKENAPLMRTDNGLLIGRDAKTDKLLRYDGPAHLLTMAPTRTGKGVGTIIPNLLTANRSVICIDPKGENALVSERARRAPTR